MPNAIDELGVTVFRRVEEAIEWADALNILRLQLERMTAGYIPSLREYNRVFGVSRERLERAKRDILILHPGPMNRGVEIDSDVADGPFSVILNQVTNGVAVRMAVLYLLVGRQAGAGGSGEAGTAEARPSGSDMSKPIAARRARHRSVAEARRDRGSCSSSTARSKRSVARVANDTADRDWLETIDCAGLVVSPGFIDVHCHLREPGREEVETIATGARAAAAGGFTAVCAMPNTDPVTDNQAAVGFIIRQAQIANAARVYPIGAISLGQRGDALAEFGEMVAAGAVAVSDDGKPVASAHLMRTALEYARTFGIPVADHCEEPTLATGGAMNEGIVSARLGLKGIPAEAEEIMAIRDILLARRTGGHVHLCHMSTRGSVELIRWGKDRSINVTAEVCPHHLSLTEDAVEGYDTNAKMNPPLRTADDVAALQEAVRDGTIDLIATDHAPHHYDEKEREFADAPNGIIGLETALAVNITWLVAPGIIDLPLLIERMSCAPARVFKLPGGTLRRGARGRRHGVRPERQVGRGTVGSSSRKGGIRRTRDKRSRAVRAARSWEGTHRASHATVTRDDAADARRAAGARRSFASAGGSTSAGWSPDRTETSRCALTDGSILVTPSGHVESRC